MTPGESESKSKKVKEKEGTGDFSERNNSVDVRNNHPWCVKSYLVRIDLVAMLSTELVSKALQGKLQ